MNDGKSETTRDGTIERRASDIALLPRSLGEGSYSSSPRESQLNFPMWSLFGIRVQAITRQDLLCIISKAVLNQAKYVVTNHNMHSLYIWHHNSKMRELYARADFTHIDGLPLIPLFRLFGARLKPKHRTAYMELLPVLATEAIKQGWRIYYLGSEPDIVEKGAALLRERYRGLQLRTHHGYFDNYGVENEAVLSDIRAYSPDVLMVGMGMPRQETWINGNLNEIAAGTIFCAGCTMDYVAGKIPSCPRWLGDIGFEWLYRLVSEPTRLWRRYLVEPWFVLGKLTAAYFELEHRLGSSDSIVEDSSE
jgi:N-acetylglucosaminyldiphosphoundecaprenol N-acetyl-beta-D-mannosaminyltransferase